MDPEEYDVIIVGSGIAGLYVAHVLETYGLTTLVLEGRDRIAGRQLTVWDDEVGYVDLGGAYVGPQQAKVLQVISDLGLETYPVATDLNFLLFDQGKRYIGSRQELPLTNPFALMDMNNFIRTVNQYSLQVDPADLWGSKVRAWDKTSVEDWIVKLCWTEFARTLMRSCVRLIYGTEPFEVSFLFFLRTLRQCGGFEILTSTSGGAQERKIKGGSGSISRKLADKLKGELRLKTGVTKIVDGEDVVCVHTEHNTTFKARKVAVCTGLAMLSEIEFEPPLLPELQEMGSFQKKSPTQAYGFKTVVYYKEQFWRQSGWHGEMISFDGPVAYSLDDTKPDGSHPAIMGFILEKTAKEMEHLTPEDRKRKICEQYAASFELPEFLEPVAYREKRWNDADGMRWNRGVCVFTTPPGLLDATFGSFPHGAHGSVHFASTELAHNHAGYMDGALRSAQHTADTIARSFDLAPPDDHLTSQFHPIPYKEMSLVEKLLPSVPLFVFLCIASVVLVVVQLWKATTVEGIIFTLAFTLPAKILLLLMVCLPVHNPNPLKFLLVGLTIFDLGIGFWLENILVWSCVLLLGVVTL